MWAVLPVKGFSESKQRLADVLTPEQRSRLSQAMFQDVLGALAGSQSVKQILVITSDDDVAVTADNFDAVVVKEPDDVRGLNAAVCYALEQVAGFGAERALILHGDVPLVTPTDLDYLASSHLEGSVTLSPDTSHSGTNGMVCDIPAELTFSYGENSFDKHRDSASKNGLLCTTVAVPGISLDVDNLSDLIRLNERIKARPQLATAQYLRRTEIQSLIDALS
ncbi:2-phospho-L-lactate guanylyltransferase [BD1-7 clade bacterium]|uniref:3-phospho-D-glycerate guanylyltransferase n=1 Tax=BD1-7 clade bacterium TaxID=2029982 RepID=A0A5S9QTG9_9GAMM|nr:2-phospho-L-lactate guanylyltransferase [BD1-7 clade bacterium]CAA0122797.1 2-phospho-L-lactate guanylyltransferase [BD1-7 clade bacterium]